MTGPLVAAVGSGPGPLLYSFTLGLVAAVNPCGFPLLPAYLSFFVGDAGDGRTQRSGRALWAGAWVSAGFLVVFGVVGILVESGVDVVLGWVPWAMIPVGTLVAGLGLATALGHQPKVPTPLRRRLGSGRGPLAMAGFGVTYAVASLTCALPLFVAAVAGSFGRLGVARGVGSVVAYALGMGLFLTVAAMVVANLGVSPLRRMGPFVRFVPRAAGAVLALVGGYLVLYWTAYLVAPTASPQPIGVVEHVQTALSNWLSGSPQLIGVVLGLALLLGLVLVALGSWRREGGASPPARLLEPAAPSRSEELSVNG